MSRIALVTYDQLPELDPDDRLAAAELRKRGHDCSAAIWNDHSVDWAQFDMAIVRSTWDYHLQSGEFFNWAALTAKKTQMQNIVGMMYLGMNKSAYLSTLQMNGVPVVPTKYISPAHRRPLREIMEGQGWQTAIIKPSVGLATYGVSKVNLDQADAHEAAIDGLLEKESAVVLVQPYLESATTYGERALIFFDGEYSHTVKKAAFQKLAVAGQAGEQPCEGSDAEIMVARLAIQKGIPFEQPPLYARVDLLRNDQNEPVVIELEVVEPSLFLSMHPRAAGLFADAIERRLAPSVTRREFHSV